MPVVPSNISAILQASSQFALLLSGALYAKKHSLYPAAQAMPDFISLC